MQGMITPYGVLSFKAQEKLQKEIENKMGPLQPWHLKEARRKMQQNGEFIPN